MDIEGDSGESSKGGQQFADTKTSVIIQRKERYFIYMMKNRQQEQESHSQQQQQKSQNESFLHIVEKVICEHTKISSVAELNRVIQKFIGERQGQKAGQQQIEECMQILKIKLYDSFAQSLWQEQDLQKVSEMDKLAFIEEKIDNDFDFFHTVSNLIINLIELQKSLMFPPKNWKETLERSGQLATEPIILKSEQNQVNQDQHNSSSNNSSDQNTAKKIRKRRTPLINRSQSSSSRSANPLNEIGNITSSSQQVNGNKNMGEHKIFVRLTPQNDYTQQFQMFHENFPRLEVKYLLDYLYRKWMSKSSNRSGLGIHLFPESEKWLSGYKGQERQRLSEQFMINDIFSGFNYPKDSVVNLRYQIVKEDEQQLNRTGSHAEWENSLNFPPLTPLCHMDMSMDHDNTHGLHFSQDSDMRFFNFYDNMNLLNEDEEDEDYDINEEEEEEEDDDEDEDEEEEEENYEEYLNDGFHPMNHSGESFERKYPHRELVSPLFRQNQHNHLHSALSLGNNYQLGQQNSAHQQSLTGDIQIQLNHNSNMLFNPPHQLNESYNFTHSCFAHHENNQPNKDLYHHKQEEEEEDDVGQNDNSEQEEEDEEEDDDEEEDEEQYEEEEEKQQEEEGGKQDNQHQQDLKINENISLEQRNRNDKKRTLTDRYSFQRLIEFSDGANTNDNNSKNNKNPNKKIQKEDLSSFSNQSLSFMKFPQMDEKIDHHEKDSLGMMIAAFGAANTDKGIKNESWKDKKRTKLDDKLVDKSRKQSQIILAEQSPGELDEHVLKPTNPYKDIEMFKKMRSKRESIKIHQPTSEIDKESLTLDQINLEKEDMKHGLMLKEHDDQKGVNMNGEQSNMHQEENDEKNHSFSFNEQSQANREMVSPLKQGFSNFQMFNYDSYPFLGGSIPFNQFSNAFSQSNWKGSSKKQSQKRIASISASPLNLQESRMGIPLDDPNSTHLLSFMHPQNSQSMFNFASKSRPFFYDYQRSNVNYFPHYSNNLNSQIFKGFSSFYDENHKLDQIHSFKNKLDGQNINNLENEGQQHIFNEEEGQINDFPRGVLNPIEKEDNSKIATNENNNINEQPINVLLQNSNAPENDYNSFNTDNKQSIDQDINSQSNRCVRIDDIKEKISSNIPITNVLEEQELNREIFNQKESESEDEGGVSGDVANSGVCGTSVGGTNLANSGYDENGGEIGVNNSRNNPIRIRKLSSQQACAQNSYNIIGNSSQNGNFSKSVQDVHNTIANIILNNNNNSKTNLFNTNSKTNNNSKSNVNSISFRNVNNNSSNNQNNNSRSNINMNSLNNHSKNELSKESCGSLLSNGEMSVGKETYKFLKYDNAFAKYYNQNLVKTEEPKQNSLQDVINPSLLRIDSSQAVSVIIENVIAKQKQKPLSEKIEKLEEQQQLTSDVIPKPSIKQDPDNINKNGKRHEILFLENLVEMVGQQQMNNGFQKNPQQSEKVLSDGQIIKNQPIKSISVVRKINIQAQKVIPPTQSDKQADSTITAPDTSPSYK